MSLQLGKWKMFYMELFIAGIMVEITYRLYTQKPLVEKYFSLVYHFVIEVLKLNLGGAG
jgi:hypothetical protein